MTDEQLILIDEPAGHVRRITLNRPHKRNAISTPLRVALRGALHGFDRDPEARVTIVRGAGRCFSSGYDLSGRLTTESNTAKQSIEPNYPSAPGDGQWTRQASDGWFSIWDLAKPVIAQVHGYAYAGGTELAAACDLVYVADDARIGYPVVRVASPPDWQYHTPLMGMRHAMEAMLTGDSVSGVEAARMGWANRAYPPGELEEAVLAVAVRIAGVATDLAQINKRMVHRAFDVLGGRAAIRSGQEFQALAAHQESVKAAMADLLGSVKKAIGDTPPT